MFLRIEVENFAPDTIKMDLEKLARISQKQSAPNQEQLFLILLCSLQ